ncbi:uncharacterized protein LOC102621122 isoform X3 [Citrus sinensis]|uniref:uncharacterized protein LOC102621122 isoform X3 n=1 Tax=Citrus sinensis TaxID=2711 RepID=UPI002279BB50|nr:uncharacterized protein LOC102621122 isoform X3 [Citrus sinensis]
MRIYELESHLSVLGFIIVAIVTHAATRSSGESSTCLTVYKEGGAPAVFQSPKCPRWKLSDYNSPPRTTSRCQSAMRQGRRKSQEDRTLCALDLHIPFPGRRGRQEVTVGIVAVFDGHNGAEASELASKLLLEYFALHTYFLLDATYSAVLKKSARRLPNKGERDIVFQVLNWDEKLGRHELKFERFKFSLPDIFDDSFHLEILREALLRAIHDIDTAFSKATSRKKLDSGSTATVVLIAEGQILVANIGDSKALLCSEKFQSPAEAKVKELTRDHHPDREDERYRVEAAGGYVLQWGGVSRVNGQLAVSRAIGDLSYKSYGVISVPEVTDWQSLTANDSYLVAASDGVFEKLSLQDVCDVFWEVHTHGTAGPGFPSSCSYSLADCLVDTAFEKGSMDNMAAVVVPLGSIYVSENLHRERRMEEGDIDCPSKGLQKLVYKQSGSGMNMNLLQLKHAHPLTTKFDRLLVEGNHGSFGCFYLSENLNDNVDSTFGAQKDDPEDYVYDLSQTLPDTLNHQYGELLNLYNDQNMCLHFGTTMDGIKDQCFKPGGFASFVGLLESIPFLDVGSEYGSNEYVMPERYVLKKRFGRGSYGEVWLAFHWNCHEGDNSSRWSELTKNVSGESICEDMSIRNPCNSSSTDDFHGGYFHDSLFILKRIMVERGVTVYLSGLREKYFGEVFLNASTSLGDFHFSATSNTFLEESRSNFLDLLETNESVVRDLGNSWSFETKFSNKSRYERASFEAGLNHIARYVESFESQSNEVWLVFRHEGISLSKLMYTVEEVEISPEEEKTEKVKEAQVLRPSKWWHWLKTTEAGQDEMRNLIWQLVCLCANFSLCQTVSETLLMALKSCHDRNITHRDIKPENMVICFEDQDTGRCLKGPPSEEKNVTTRMRIIDFGSAIDDFTVKHLYGSTGPSKAEQTSEYTPPEAFLNATWYQGPIGTTLKYDMWSVGVVILEMILGSPNVFQISDLTRALLDHHLEGWNDSLKELAFRLRSYMELCILIPGGSSKLKHTSNQGGLSPASWKCSEEFFSLKIKGRDPLKQGFPNVWALRLVRQLLLWDAEDRLSVDVALRHPYFQPSKR